MIIPLTKGMFATIDEMDSDTISQYKWYVLKIGYAATSIGGRKNKRMIYMHRLITGAESGETVDHIDGNKLNNSRSNLRICSQRQNTKNRTASSIQRKTSRFKGVCFDKIRNKWIASIKVNYKKWFLGRFDDEETAARKYDLAARYYFGEFAKTNFPYDPDKHQIMIGLLV